MCVSKFLKNCCAVSVCHNISQRIHLVIGSILDLIKPEFPPFCVWWCHKAAIKALYASHPWFWNGSNFSISSSTVTNMSRSKHMDVFGDSIITNKIQPFRKKCVSLVLKNVNFFISEVFFLLKKFYGGMVFYSNILPFFLNSHLQVGKYLLKDQSDQWFFKHASLQI